MQMFCSRLSCCVFKQWSLQSSFWSWLLSEPPNALIRSTFQSFLGWFAPSTFLLNLSNSTPQEIFTSIKASSDVHHSLSSQFCYCLYTTWIWDIWVYLSLFYFLDNILSHWCSGCFMYSLSPAILHTVLVLSSHNGKELCWIGLYPLKMLPPPHSISQSFLQLFPNTQDGEDEFLWAAGELPLRFSVSVIDTDQVTAVVNDHDNIYMTSFTFGIFSLSTQPV